MGSTMSTLLASGVIFLAFPPGASAADGVDFSNNLFSDLGPVLALFGEQVAKQFMSQSMSWLEDVIFAMAPLGIITAIISAVRVGGPNWLKAVVGRARESGAVAEMELMSSTSHEVCELWNGQSIVRVMGSPDILEILYFEDMADSKDKCGLFTIQMAVKEGLLRNAKESRKDGLAQVERDLPTTEINGDAPDTRKGVFSGISSRASSKGNSVNPNPANTSRLATSNSAPNISLNFVEIQRQRELWLFAILGFVLQFGSVVFIGITRYRRMVDSKEDGDSKYAYPLMASGTLLLVMGMMACSHVVQTASVETTWVADKNFKILWLQKSATVSDQLFGSYVLFADKERNRFTTSRRRTYVSTSKSASPPKHTFAAALTFQNLTIATIVGSLLSLTGFVTQFVGIRALHWSASIIQLVVTLAMTAVRTWIRRNMSARPRAISLPAADEIDWLAVKFGASAEMLWELGDHHGHNGPEGDGDGGGDPGLEVLTLRPYHGYRNSGEADASKPMTDVQRTIKMRVELGRLTDWKELSYPFALELAKCLQSLLSCFMASQDITLNGNFKSSDAFQWTLPVKVGHKEERVTITATRPAGQRESENWLPWDVSAYELSAIISLWSCKMKEYEQALEGTSNQERSFRGDGYGAPTVLRVLGPVTNLLIRDCEWWMDRGGRFAVVETSELQKNAKLSGKVTTLETKEFPKTTAQINRSAAKNSTVSVAPHRIMGAEPIWHESLVFISETPLLRMCAQEILSSFMWAIAGAVQSITSGTEPRGAALPRVHESRLDGWFDFKLENTFFQKLADTITESGVTSNNQDAYALVIPPFAAIDKLPGVSYVVSETHRKIKSLQVVEKQENITKIRKAYIELFKICNSSRRTHSTTITVTALLMEELCCLNNAVALYENRANFENEGEKIRKSLDHIKNQLIENGDKDTLGALIYLYEKQDRDAGGIGQLPSTCAAEIRATCEFEDLKKLEERAGWNLAHKLVTDDGDHIQEIVDMAWERIPRPNNFDLDAIDILGWAPLHYAANKPGDQSGLVWGILDAGGQVDPGTKLDYTPLHYAAAKGHTQVASRLCGAGAAKDARNIDLRTPLHLAAERGHPATTKFLLSKGVDVEARDKYGWTPLHYAAAKGRKDVVEQLLAKGAMEDARENLEMTPLHMAASSGQLEIVEILLGRDPQTAPLDYTGRTPLHLAALNGNGEVAETLITNTGPNVMDREKSTPLHYAAWRGNLDVVNRLLRKGANPNPLNHTESTPLHLACRNGHIKVVNELLSAGANPTLKGPASQDQTPLEELEANKKLPEAQHNELIALLEGCTKSWLTEPESRASQIFL